MGFFEEVYKAVRLIPSGKVATYGQISGILGTKDARKVGWALHANRNLSVPCHRVVGKEGGLSASFAFDGMDEQTKRLKGEGVYVEGQKVNLSKYLWKP